jgi:hypothetical protein
MTNKHLDQAVKELAAEFTADMKHLEAVLEKVVQLLEAEHLPVRLVGMLASRLAGASLKGIEDPQVRLLAFEAHTQIIACLIGIKMEMFTELVDPPNKN